MSIRSLESEILRGARTAFNFQGLRLKDIQEWSTASIAPRAGESVCFLDDLKMYVAIKSENDKRKKS